MVIALEIGECSKDFYLLESCKLKLSEGKCLGASISVQMIHYNKEK